MVQVRKLVLAIAAASALSSGMANALGLGGLTVKSSLNQPLLAEIELTQVQDLNSAQVVPSLATSAEFAQAGVGRTAILDDLVFTPVVNPGGRSVLRITSTKPVRDPYVKFLVQVLWPNGRALREYSLLLDPPKASPQAAAAAAAQLPSTAPAVAPAQAPAAQVTPPAAPTAQAPAEPKYTQYTTANNDTLWEIAERVRSGGTVQQTMLAIQALNPDAFIGGNINRLKKGQVLRLPTAQEVSATPQPRAIAEVAEQNRAWREGRRLPAGARQVDATRRDRAGAAPSRIEAKDNLSLVAANANPGAKGSAGDADLANKLAVAQENLDSTRRDNAELKSRMTDLQSQLDKLQRLIELKNDQLAKMQAAGAAVPPAGGDANSAVSPNSVTNPNNAANPIAAQIVPPAPDSAGKPPNEIAPEDALPVEGAKIDTAGADQPPATQPEAEPRDNQSALDKILASPMLMGLIAGAAVLVLLLLVLLLVRRRNAILEAERHRQMARALSEESDFAADMNMPESSFEGLEVPPPAVKQAPLAAVIIEPTRERPTDVLVQAEIHIAYGRMNQAAALLEEAIKEEPQRSELRLKLMEIYAQQGNERGFVAQERQLVATGRNHAEVEQLKARYPAMAAAAVAAAGVAATAALAAQQMDARYVEDLLTDHSETAAAPELEPAPESEPAPETLAEAPDDFDTAFDLSLDDLEAASPAEVEDRSAPLADRGFDDLDLDAPFGGSTPDELDFDAILREQTEAQPAAGDGLEDFDLNLGEDEPALKAEDDRLLGVRDELSELPAFDDPADLGADKLAQEDELELPADFDLSLADEMESDPASKAFASEIDDVNAELERLSQSLEQPPMATPFDEATFGEDDALLADDSEPEFDFLSGTDEAATKLDLARAYIEMGDADGARDILDEVVAEGDDGQKSEAREMLSRLA
ncbi:tetratricopeptide repeat protein [Pseudomonas sp. GD03842]|uniref:FimV/HubP family polar landmark protein n=1 Tax=Pseudomonas sp. GD03842 TaxID=2975385 RepID=UPI00244983E0|nr:FimV/HubP family polar landmark protein [Pseudomonas sp. GD03842]MDH0748093.1 tetratricopeptide repeat protein [Pseudomonas sp. GD03842]